MQLRDIMTRDPAVIGPDATLKEAAGKMHEIDSGVMPIGENDRLVGMLTDRDITVRAVPQLLEPWRTTKSAQSPNPAPQPPTIHGFPRPGRSR
jgi:CBS domain-containing protein